MQEPLGLPISSPCICHPASGTLSVSPAVVLRQGLNSIAQAGLALTLLQAVLDPLSPTLSVGISVTSHQAQVALSLY